MKNKNLLIVVIVFGLLLVVTFIYRQVNKSKLKGLKQTAVLTLESNSSEISVGGELTVNMTLDSKANEVAAADFVLQFDPEYFSVASVSTGNFFSNYPVNITGKNFVKLSGVATFDGETLTLPKGRNSVGQIAFKSTGKTGKTEFRFDSNKTIVATNGQNILDTKQLTGLLINVK